MVMPKKKEEEKKMPAGTE